MSTTSTRGYKVKLDGGMTLIAEISERGWTVKVKGDGWKSGIHSSAPIWEDHKKWEGLPNTLGIDAAAWNEFRASVEQQEAEAAKAKPETPTAEEVPVSIKKAARRIAEKGNPLKFMLNTFNRTHKGDSLHAESQLIGFGMQSAHNSMGVFGTWDGPSGKGKSDGAKACVRQLPPEYVITSSITAKSLYHRAKDGGVLPGSVLYLDDKSAKCGGLIVLRLSDPVSYAYDTQCKCRSKPYKYNTDLAMVNADERELLPCDRDSRISFYLEVYLALIPGKILAKCSRVA